MILNCNKNANKICINENSIYLCITIKDMTIDKIKYYMNPTIFKHWTELTNIEAINKARVLLKEEIDLGLLKGIEFIAELNLLNQLAE